MAIGMLIFPFLAEIAILVWALRRTGFMPFPHALMLYALGTQVVVWAVAQDYLYYDFLKVYSTYAFAKFYPQVFLTFAAFFGAAALCVPKQGARISEVVKSLRISTPAGLGIIGFLYLQLAIEMAALDWGVAWSNSEYLMMAGSGGLRHPNALTQTFHSANGLCGLIATLLLAFFTFTKRPGLALATLPVATWHFLFQLAGHSRYAAFFLIAFAAAGAVLSSKRFPPLVVTVGLCGLMTLVSVLGGRTSNMHGFASLPSYFENVESRLETDPAGTFINIFEGGFVSSEHLTGQFNYPDQFKILSLSPLLSSIDGYEDARLRGEARLDTIVPAGAINEVLSFGLIYSVIYFGFQFAAGFLSARLLARNPNLFSLSVNALMMFASYIQFTYSTRTVFRLFIIVLVVAGFGLLTARRQRRGGQMSLLPPISDGANGEAPARNEVLSLIR